MEKGVATKKRPSISVQSVSAVRARGLALIGSSGARAGSGQRRHSTPKQVLGRSPCAAEGGHAALRAKTETLVLRRTRQTLARSCACTLDRPWEQNPPAHQAPQGCMPHARTGSLGDFAMLRQCTPVLQQNQVHPDCNCCTCAELSPPLHQIRADQIRTWPRSHVGPA